jgi:hypothetical protein
MRLATSLFLLLFMISVSEAAKAHKFAYPPQKLSANGIQEIKVSGVKGRLTIRGNKSQFFKIKVSHSKNKRFEDWSLSVDRQGDALVLEVFNVALGPQWRNLVRAELWPEFDIEIEGPSVPALVSWREGQLNFVNWKSDLEAAYLKGNFKASGMRGRLKLQAVNGQIEISDLKGSLNLKGEQGKLELSKIQGPVKLSWLHGVLNGKILSGPLTLDIPSGHARLTQINGKVIAKGGSSEWDLAASAPSDIEVTTDSGPVKIRWSGGAKLFLTSSTGAISVPKPFRVESRDGVKVVEGEKEMQPKGQVFVRTQSGKISWQ